MHVSAQHERGWQSRHSGLFRPSWGLVGSLSQPRRAVENQVLFGPVFLLTGFRLLITAFHEVRRLIKHGFEHAEHLLVYPHQSTVRIATLMGVEQPCMVADIRQE